MISLIIIGSEHFNSFLQSFSGGDICPLITGGITGFTRIKMILTGLALLKLIGAGSFKPFDSRFMSLDFWHILAN